MALIFSMWIETETKHQDKAVRDFFEIQTITSNGKNYVIKTFEGGMITVDGISRIGINSASDATEMTAIGFEFYKLLVHAPTFRYAITGVEVDGFRWMKEIEEDPNDIFMVPGIVIRKDIYKKIGSPGQMIEFNSEYLWTPYQGETWTKYTP